MFYRLIFFTCAMILTEFSFGGDMQRNLLQNPDFDFHTFVNHRDGIANSHTFNNVAFWNTDAWQDITVTRESHVAPEIRPPNSVHNIVTIAPGKKFRQFFTLPEASLASGEKVSLSAGGYQETPGALKASIKLLKLDSEEGTWTPGDFGYADKRTFQKQARGELIVAKAYETTSDQTGAIELEIHEAEIIGRVNGEDPTKGVNTIGVSVEFENTSTNSPVWIYTPCLSKSNRALKNLPITRPMVAYYRNIPRTIQKLWKGETLHIMIMGSSIDRGSANPPLYLYDEDPASPDFKKPISERMFEASQINRPDLDGHFGWWNHFFSYGGRLKLELMRKFNLPASKICLTFMACDGSCVGEAHSGLKEYFSLSLPPSENGTGHRTGMQWDELHPDLFNRPQGPAPDLVIFGSGANEKTDTPDEVAVFEGMIRWIQRHSPNTEFLFSPFQNYGGYTPTPGDLMALSLRYQIPFLDYGKNGDDAVRWCNRFALVPADGHPQAAAHYLWFKQIEKAFECWDPITPGIAQLQLPERVHRNTYGWEGEMVTFDEQSPRIQNARFIFEDTALNCWAKFDRSTVTASFLVDGKKCSSRQSPYKGRDIRNSTFRHGNCSLGDRHVLEITGQDVELVAVDSKVCPGRRYFQVDNRLWKNKSPVTEFKSDWGAPYGNKKIVLNPGEQMTIDVVCTDISVAYVDHIEGGEISLTIDGVEKLLQPTNIPYIDQEENDCYIENRKGVLNLGFGLHAVSITATQAPVTILGLYTYDSRPNRSLERRLSGFASSGETVVFSHPFKARPMIICGNGISIKNDDITNSQATFSGENQGWYEVIGE